MNAQINAKKFITFALAASFGLAGCTTVDPNTGAKVPNKAATGAITTGTCEHPVDGQAGSQRRSGGSTEGI